MKTIRTMLFLLGLTGTLLLHGCVLRHQSPSYDGIAEQVNASELTALAQQAADELANAYAPAHTPIVLHRTTGVFSDALEHALRLKGFALYGRAENMDLLSLQYTVDTLRDGAVPAVFVRLSLSDGRMFSVVRRVRPEVAKQADPFAPVHQQPVVAPPFSMPEPAPLVQATPLTDTNALAAAGLPSSERQVVTPKEKDASPAIPAKEKRTMVLPKAVLTVLPYNWRYTIPDAAKRQMKVSEPANIPWRDAIRTMAQESGCEARFDETSHRVTLAAVKSASTSNLLAEPASSIVPSTVPPASALHPALLPESASKSVPVMNLGASPVVKAALQNAQQVAPAPALDPVETVMESASTQESQEKTWELEPGSLYVQLERWAVEAGYQLVWKADKDLTMESSTVFKGSLTDAVRKLFAGLSKSGHGLRVTFYQTNSVMEVRGE